MKTGHDKFLTRATIVAVCMTAVVAIAVAADRNDESDTTGAGVATDIVATTQHGAESFGPFYPTVVNVDLRQLPTPAPWLPGDPIKEIPRRENRNDGWQPPVVDVTSPTVDPLLQHQFAAAPDTRAFGTPLLNIAGQGFSGVNPPDPSGEVGADYYIQVINGGGGALVRVYDKTDGSIEASFSMESLGTGSCASGLGDGVVLYDQLAGRWLLTEFSSGGNRVCMYVSQTGDPIVGGWFAYEITAPSFPDYPKYGVWPDAYYVSSNEGSSAAYAIDRTAMLVGGAATFQRFAAPNLAGFGFQALNPTDHDGTTLPPAGTPNYFFRHRDDEVHGGSPSSPTNDWLEFWEFNVDFAVPGNSTFTGPTSIPIAEIDSTLCGLTSFSCFAQPGTGTQLDPLREVVMFPIGYRNFGSHQSIVGNLTTDVGVDDGGIRWFELRRTGVGPWSLFQEGTFAPDGDSRFMGSIKQDGDGNMAVGYSVTSSSTFPSIRYTGRLIGDASGTMRPESVLVNGIASNSSNRWGDYSQMSVDPEDECTFWYTMEYNTTGSWSTRIGSFKFDECGEPGFTLSATNTIQEVCAPDSLTDIDLTIGQVQGFTDPVTLSYVGFPAGFSGGFTANPVNPPGSSTAQVSVGAASAGSHSFDILGTATGADDRTATVLVDVFTATSGAPTLLTPADGATNVTSPNLTWSAVAQATSYFVEIATAPDFTASVSATVSGTSHNFSGLTPDTDHYWRVTPLNPCGTGTTSAVRTFRTSLTICSAPGLPINDNSTTTDTMTLALSGTLDDLDVNVDLSHTFLGDLFVDLTHVDTGTTVRLFNRSCSSSNDMDITFDDEAASAASASCTNGTPGILPGSYTPFQPLSAFDGESLAGDWTISVTDNAGVDTGALNEWCLTPGLIGTCGDNIVDAGEDCDDGNTTNGDGCDSNCKDEVCGNGIVQTGNGEECDDGNTSDDDGCDSNCIVEFCGDGIVNDAPNEECDDSNTTNGDGCDSNCVIEVCGNGVVQAGNGEECDDNNTTSGDGCDATCQDEFCGDSVVQAGLGEQCDDGNTTNGDSCDSNCIVEVCGNGVLQDGEQCDDGNTIDTDACSNSCTLNVDPNILVNGDFEAGEPPWIHFTNGGGSYDVVGGEARLSFTSDGTNVQLYQRDIATDSNTGHTISFRARHTVPNRKIVVRFGNHVSPFQSFGISRSVTLSTTMTSYSFDFNTTSDSITNGRLMFLVSDADVVGSNIFFDDVVLKITAPDLCGNGGVDAGETCDGANLDGETCSSQSFDGGTLACNATCDGFDTSACFVCGDNTINGTETCDGSDLGGMSCSDFGFNAGTLGCAAACDNFDTSMCTVCGDNDVDPGEQCDDGNTTNGDGCDANCQTEACGNGLLQSGEQCDDGDLDNGDGCDSNCVLEVCGNGVLQSGEQCDDGNTTNGDTCDANCNNEVCGNGIVQAGEQCDDGNLNNTDACSNACTINAVTNIVVNGNFSAGTAPWIFYTNGGGNFQVIGGEARLSFTANGSNVQLYQRNIAADSNTDYRLTFRARHSLAGKRITVRFAKHGAPYTFYGLSQRVNLTTSMQTFSIDFTTTSQTITDARLMFLASDADTPGSTIHIDDVVLAPAGPTTCGNGALDAGEACDGGNLNGQTCSSQGFDGGTLSCNPTCDGFVTSSCFGCGDGVVNGGEVCDGADLDGETCATQGFNAGTLSCNASCNSFVTSSCSTCGDGIVGNGETCDDGNTTSGDGCSSTCQTEGGGPNLVVNGNFTAGTSNWNYNANGNSSFSVVGGVGFVDVTTPGSSVQLYQRNITLQPNTTYRLTFRGRNTDGDNVRMRVIRHTSPYTNYGLDRVVNLTTSMQTFTMTFTTPGGSLAAARLQFWIAPYDMAGNDYYFDDVVLEQN